jgi:hypothetical protein
MKWPVVVQWSEFDEMVLDSEGFCEQCGEPGPDGLPCLECGGLIRGVGELREAGGLVIDEDEGESNQDRAETLAGERARCEIY